MCGKVLPVGSVGCGALLSVVFFGGVEGGRRVGGGRSGEPWNQGGRYLVFFPGGGGGRDERAEQGGWK